MIGKTNTILTDLLPPIGTPLADCTWEEISKISTKGVAPTYFAVGDEKDILIGAETVTLEIAGFNHDTLSSDDTSKAGITFVTKNCLGTTRVMNATLTNSGGWDSSAMRTWVVGTLLSSLPNELQAVLKTVNKLTSAGSSSATINTAEDKLFLLSEVELFGLNTYSYSGEGAKYDVFTDNASRIKKLGNGGSAQNYFTRSPRISSNTRFAYASVTGTAGDNDANEALGVVFGLCV